MTAQWKYEDYSKTIRSVPENYWIATMDSWDGAVDHASNARLIAAAPELLEALKQAVSWVEYLNYHETYPHLNQAELRIMRAAIAKATGGDDVTDT